MIGILCGYDWYWVPLPFPGLGTGWTKIFVFAPKRNRILNHFFKEKKLNFVFAKSDALFLSDLPFSFSLIVLWLCFSFCLSLWSINSFFFLSLYFFWSVLSSFFCFFLSVCLSFFLFFFFSLSLYVCLFLFDLPFFVSLSLSALFFQSSFVPCCSPFLFPSQNSTSRKRNCDKYRRNEKLISKSGNWPSQSVNSVWPDLTKIRHFGKILKVFGRYVRVC